jgi:hypothetical protein
MIPLYPKSWQRAAILVTIAAILVVGLCAWPYTVDDAFIVARYASRLARGLGYTFNDGPPSDGVTGPLWLLPGLAASRAQLDPVWTAKAVGLACVAFACGAFVWRLSRRSRGTSYACSAAALFACQPDLGGWGVAGLETGAATLVLTSAWLVATERPALQQRALLGTLLALLPWLRPELLAVTTVIWIVAGWRLGLARAAPVYALSAIGVIALGAFRWTHFGSVLPLAYHAKQGSLGNGFDYGLRGVLLTLGVFGGLLLVRAMRFGRWDDRVGGVLFLVHSVAVVLAGGDWMPGFRLFVPVLPIALAGVAVGLVRPGPDGRAELLRASRPELRLERFTRRNAGYGRMGLALLTVGVLALDLATRIPEWRAAGTSRENVGRELALRLRQSARRVALVDIGFLGYASGVEAIDLGGITDAEIGRLPGGHLSKSVTDGLLSRRAPDALILHSAQPPLVAADGRLLAISGYPVEQRIASGAWVRSHFRVALQRTYAPRYHYVLLLTR